MLGRLTLLTMCWEHTTCLPLWKLAGLWLLNIEARKTLVCVWLNELIKELYLLAWQQGSLMVVVNRWHTHTGRFYTTDSLWAWNCSIFIPRSCLYVCQLHRFTYMAKWWPSDRLRSSLRKNELVTVFTELYCMLTEGHRKKLGY